MVAPAAAACTLDSVGDDSWYQDSLVMPRDFASFRARMLERRVTGWAGLGSMGNPGSGRSQSSGYRVEDERRLREFLVDTADEVWAPG